MQQHIFTLTLFLGFSHVVYFQRKALVRHPVIVAIWKNPAQLKPPNLPTVHLE